MIREAVAFVFVAVVLLNMESYDEVSTFSETSEPVSVSSPSSSAGSSASSSRSSGKAIRLYRRADGHFYADVTVNGKKLEFLVDTGASGIALTPDDARRAGVDLDPDASDVVGMGAGGPVSGQIVMLDRVALGSNRQTDMRAAVIEGAETNLLGQSFLSEFREVTVKNDVMTLR